jgi:ApbE superfamily uncharacterized protein (UPF0280 family)
VYEPRVYRSRHSEKDLCRFRVAVDETDLDIAVKKDRYTGQIRDMVEQLVQKERQVLQEYIKKDPVFLRSLEPHQPLTGAPFTVVEMCEKSRLAGVGPMAAVAGLFAELAGKLLARYSRDVIVENGGDIWLKTSRARNVAIYAGVSPFSYRVGLEIRPVQTPLGICTSSGTVGHSLSFGRADAVVVLAPSAVLADAVATAACNMVQEAVDLKRAVEFALAVPGVSGAVAIMGDRIAAVGRVKLVPLEFPQEC